MVRLHLIYPTSIRPAGGWRRSSMRDAARTLAPDACFQHSHLPQALPNRHPRLWHLAEPLVVGGGSGSFAAGRCIQCCMRAAPRAGGRASSAAAARPCTRGRHAGCTCGAASARARPCSWTSWPPARRQSFRRVPGFRLGFAHGPAGGLRSPGAAPGCQESSRLTDRLRGARRCGDPCLQAKGVLGLLHGEAGPRK